MDQIFVYTRLLDVTPASGFLLECGITSQFPPGHQTWRSNIACSCWETSLTFGLPITRRNPAAWGIEMNSRNLISTFAVTEQWFICMFSRTLLMYSCCGWWAEGRIRSFPTPVLFLLRTADINPLPCVVLKTSMQGFRKSVAQINRDCLSSIKHWRLIRNLKWELPTRLGRITFIYVLKVKKV